MLGVEPRDSTYATHLLYHGGILLHSSVRSCVPALFCYLSEKYMQIIYTFYIYIYDSNEQRRMIQSCRRNQLKPEWVFWEWNKYWRRRKREEENEGLGRKGACEQKPDYVWVSGSSLSFLAQRGTVRTGVLKGASRAGWGRFFSGRLNNLEFTL